MRDVLVVGVGLSCVLAETVRWVKTCWVGLSSKLAGEMMEWWD